jgi:glycosyltransferase involved in cell wall biosynthesis
MAEVLRRNGITKNLTIVPFGVDQDNFTPQRRSQEWRSAHGVGPQEVLVGFVGRLVWEKSLGLWAEVIRRLEAAGIPHRSVMVGEGPAGPELQKMLPNTRFTGRLTGPDLATAFASMDLFFHPSDSETFGCVTVEALASGLACLVADATGSRDIVRHDQEGLVCPPHQPEAFFQALLQLIQNPVLRQRYQAQALQRANAYRWENVLAEMLGNFRRVASQRPIRRLRKTSST